MSAVFNFQSLLVVALLIICTCAYIRSMYPSILDRNRKGFLGIFWKAARIGKSLVCFPLTRKHGGRIVMKKKKY